LYIQWNTEHKVLDLLDGTSLNDLAFVFLGACGEIAKSRDSVTLYLLVLLEGEKLNQRMKEASFNDGAFIKRVNGYIAYACCC
jgi:hypothetical protein